MRRPPAVHKPVGRVGGPPLQRRSGRFSLATPVSIITWRTERSSIPGERPIAGNRSRAEFFSVNGAARRQRGRPLMSSPPTPPSIASSEAPTRDGRELENGFCPHQGLIAQSSLEFQEQVRVLLASRLRIAAVILFGGFAGFLVQSLLFGPMVEEFGRAVRVPHVLVTIVEGLLVVMLCRRCRPSLMKLRIAEGLMFGMPAAFFAFAQYLGYTMTPAVDAEAYGYRLVAYSVPWIMLLEVYGLFIPNACRRTAVVVTLIALAPLTIMIFAGFERPVLLDTLYSGALLTNLLHMTIASVIAVYGSHRFGALRREAFDLKKVGVYTLRRPLGGGGMGEVFLAEHRLLKRPCAVKLIRPDRAGDASSVARFESEVQATAQLTHPNTIEIYDYGVTGDGVFFYVMEYLPGLSLQEIVDRTGPMSAARVVHLLRQVCAALSEAHAAGLIHRDIKPGNIFAAERGGIRDFAKLLDFGLVKSTGPESDELKHTMEGVVVGSPMYAAPETTLGSGTVDARADIYSLGATAFFLLTGRPVFERDKALQLVVAHAQETPAAPSSIATDVPRDFEAVVLKCLEKSPSDRFASASELEAALAACVDADRWRAEDAEQWWSETADFSFDDESVPAPELAETAVGRPPDA